jgi:tRNA pseudouridine65 synthase
MIPKNKDKDVQLSQNSIVAKRTMGCSHLIDPRSARQTDASSLSTPTPNPFNNLNINNNFTLHVRGNVKILLETDTFLVIDKPPAVVVHHSAWTASHSHKDTVGNQNLLVFCANGNTLVTTDDTTSLKNNTNSTIHDDTVTMTMLPDIPMIQRVRQATGRRVNLVHRLDRGCSGCLLMAYANDDASDLHNPNSIDLLDHDNIKNCTRVLIESMADNSAKKLYVAFVRGEGILHGRNFCKEGWFCVNEPIKNEKKSMQNNTITWFRFIAGQDNQKGTINRPRVSIVLCRPETGRWHQIRKHLNHLSHPILGDSTHGSSQVNRQWKQEYGMSPERTCLHLAHIHLAPSLAAPQGLSVSSPLPLDMIRMLSIHAPDLWERAQPFLVEEGIRWHPADDDAHTVLPFEIQINSHVERKHKNKR